MWGWVCVTKVQYCRYPTAVYSVSAVLIMRLLGYPPQVLPGLV